MNLDANAPAPKEARIDRPLRIWLPAVKSKSGADMFVNRLAAGLQRAGHDPVVQWFSHSFELMPDRLKRMNMPPKTDVVHAGAWQGFAFKRTGVPLVVTEHHDVMDPEYAPYKTISQAAYHRLLVNRWMGRSFMAADLVTAVSEFTAEVLRQKRGVKCTAVPNWVDTTTFSPAAHTRSIRGGKFKLLFVGNQSRRKGADILATLGDRLGDEFIISSTGGLREFGHSSSSNINYLGRLSTEALVEAYRDSDAVLVPSRYEGFGYSAAEAMACAKPVVGFRCGALQELMATIDDCALCDVNDVDGLVNICRELKNDPERAAKIGSNGRKVILARYSEGAAINRYVGLYASLLGEMGG